jgi:hypothetical protein
MLLIIAFLIFSLSALTVKGQVDGAIRLWANGVSSSTLSSGRVRVYLNDMWGNICGNYASPFGQEEADVTCRSLGYVGAIGHSTFATDGYGFDPYVQVIDDVVCSSSLHYLHLFQCRFSTIIDSPCSSSDDVGVSCCKLYD